VSHFLGSVLDLPFTILTIGFVSATSSAISLSESLIRETRYSHSKGTS
jgi:hypothetical protein